MNNETNNEYLSFKERVQSMIDNKLEDACIDYIEKNNGNTNDETD